MLEDIKLPFINKRVINMKMNIKLGKLMVKEQCIVLMFILAFRLFIIIFLLTDQTNRQNCYIEINHCLKGKFECQYNKDYYAYLCEGI